MQEISFINIPEQYKSQINKIQDSTIQKLYSEFNFLYFPLNIILCNLESKFSQDSDKYSYYIEDYLFNYFKNFKFITYRYINNLETKNDDKSTQKIDVILCLERNCIIIEEINKELMNKIIRNLKEIKCSLINFSENSQNEEEKTNEKESKEEVKNFYKNYRFEIQGNSFVKKTIFSIAGYIIRRYFYPTDYFKDGNFFLYDKLKIQEQNHKEKLRDLIISQGTKEKEQLINELMTVVDEINNDDSIFKQEFQENDFVILRTLHQNDYSNFNLVINKKTLFIYMMKKVINNNNLNHEIYFCDNFSHRCLTTFYGYVRKNGNIVGFIYEFMSNGPLDIFVENHQKEIAEDFSVMTINRLVQGIYYLHEHNLIHRDLKPSNILINHDFVPFISDFDTIRHPLDEESKSEMTSDIGSILYSSPEQKNNTFVSYPTDIYSLGLIIYFIFEKKDMYSNENQTISKIMINCSKTIEELLQNCIKFSPEKRKRIDQVRFYFIEEINSFDYYEKYLLEKDNQNKISDIFQFIYENIILIGKKNSDAINKCLCNIFHFSKLFMIKMNQNYSILLFNFGNFYYTGEEQRKDYNKANQYYTASSELNNSNAFVCLGNMYFFGHGQKQDYLKAMEYYELAAKQNNPNAFYNIGNLYLYGYGVKQDYLEASKYFELAAKLNFTVSFLSLGHLYLYGYGVKKDYLKAKECFEMAAKNNNSTAFYYLGILYENGYGVEQNFLKANEYYKLAAKQNNSESLLKLGNLYFNGNGVKQSFLKAKEYYELSAKLNNSEALLNLGDMYYEGEGVKINYGKAKEYYELSAKLNNSEALLNLGNMYYEGEGVKINYGKAKEYYELSAKLNNSEALLNLGILYYNGHGVKQDYSQAKYYYELSASQNNSDAFFNLGIMYQEGRGVKENFLKAKEYYELAAKQNNPEALNSLGDLYYNGLGIEKDYLKAKEYYELAATQNNSEALNSLGDLYYNGLGIEKDYLKAKEYYELAAKQNNSEALNSLGDLYYNGLGIEKDYLKAKEYYELASELDNPDAFYNLGLLYQNATGVERDIFLSKEYYESSSELGNPNADFNLGYLYLNGDGVQKDYQKAKTYFESAAKEEIIPAYNILGIIYLEGLGVNKDYCIAKYYFELAAKENDSDAFIYLGYLYLEGKGVEINYTKAIKYFTISSQQNNSIAFTNLGYLYYYGYGVKQNYLKAKEYFEMSAKLNDSYSINCLGDIYLNGLGVPKDYPRARYYYELSSNLNNSTALNNLGYIYLNGIGVDQDYKKAIEYFNLSSQQKNVIGLINLGNLYYDGIGVEKDYQKAKDYYELASIQNNSLALLKVGECYYYGHGVEKDKLKAFDLFKLAAKQDNPNSLFYLGYLYMNEYFEINYSKAIQFFLRCSKIRIIQISSFDLSDYSSTHFLEFNAFCYRAFNYLGLIYIAIFQDIEKSYEYLKEAAFGEYPPGQNNFGLFNQFYLNKKENAEYMYKRASEHNFQMADFNLAHLKESEGKIEESIEYYKKASENENERLIFHNYEHYDEEMEISKIFIICLANLKLSHHYFSSNNFKESKEYFIKAFHKIKSSNYPFQFQLENNKDVFSFLMSYILNYQPFNLIDKIDNNNFSLSKINIQIEEKMEIKKGDFNSQSKRKIDDFGELFDFIIENPIKNLFMSEVHNIIMKMEEILYSEPYFILFGKIIINKKEKTMDSTSQKNINKTFYEGFELNIL